MRWLIHATDFGKEFARSDGGGLIGAHVEAPDVFSADLQATPHVGHIVLALCSQDMRYYVDDVLSYFVYKPLFRLLLHGRPLVFRYNGEAGKLPARKRRQDDWCELKASPDAAFVFERWDLHRAANHVAGLLPMLSDDKDVVV